MSENDSSHIDMVADSVTVGSDMCQYSWVVRLGILVHFFGVATVAE